MQTVGQAISLLAIHLSTNVRSSSRYTFGLARAETLGALSSTLITWALTAILVYEAVQRASYILSHNGRPKDPVDGPIVTAIAGGGILVNICLMAILGVSFQATAEAKTNPRSSLETHLDILSHTRHYEQGHGHSHGGGHCHAHSHSHSHSHGHGHPEEAENLNVRAAYLHGESK